ncbi:MAG: hypothetical protein ABSF18_01560, partial [Gammaproteobacteria bacterium]
MKKIINHQTTIYFLTMLVVFICIFLRFSTEYSVSDYLWAEDGQVFLTQALQMGLNSLWEPYAGYLHLYPRLFA